jgi:type III restriction enzyme
MQGFVDAKGKVQDTLRAALKDGTFALPKALEAHLASVRDVLKKVAGTLDVKNADDRVVVKTRQAILESAEFQALGSHQTQDDLSRSFQQCEACNGLRQGNREWAVSVKSAGSDQEGRSFYWTGGVEAQERDTNSGTILTIEEGDIALPDVLTDLQDRTQLTRRSLVHILDGVRSSDGLQTQPSGLHRDFRRGHQPDKRLALVDGIKYQRIGPDHYYGQELFQQEELTGYLRNMLTVKQSSNTSFMSPAASSGRLPSSLRRTKL